MFVDNINNPEHYEGEIQPIDFIRAQGWFPDYAAGNIIKYVSRYKRKNGVEDLEKAQRYLTWLIEHQRKNF